MNFFAYKIKSYFKCILLYCFKDVLWFYTLFAVFLKSVILLGFTYDSTHTGFNLFETLNHVSPRLKFYFGFIIIFLSFAFLLKNRLRLWYLVVMNLFFSTLFFVDLLYYRGFNVLPSMQQLNQTSNFDNLSESILSLIYGIDSIFFIDVALLILIAVFIRKLYRKTDKQKAFFTVSLLISVFVVSYIPVSVNFFGGMDTREAYIQYDPAITSYNLSPIGYHVLNAITYWKDSQPYTLSDEEKGTIETWFARNRENLPDNKYKALFKGKNLIFIQVESLENFVINQKINGQEITPNLNKIIKNSLYFKNFYEQTNQGNSSDADLIANTSIYPLRQGSTFFTYPYTTYNSLPKLLQRLGYKTLAVHPDKGSFWNWMTALKSIGFERCIDSTFFTKDEVIGLGLSDRSYLKQLEPVIASQKQPFYTFLVTMTSHGPFNLPSWHRELTLAPELDRSTMGGYFQSLRYTDRHIGSFIDSLKKDGLLDNTVIVIYGDHEGVHKYYPVDIQRLSYKEDWWLDNKKQLPLLIYQNHFQGEEISTIGGQVDILPTVAYLMGVEENEYLNSAIGRNLLKTNKSFAVMKNMDYIGEGLTYEEREHAVKGLDISNILIRSDYFKESR